MPTGLNTTAVAVAAVVAAAAVVVWMLSRRSRKGGAMLPQSGTSDFQEVELVQRDPVSDDTVRLLFAMPVPFTLLGLPAGKHIAVRASIDGKVVLRSYTPVSTDEDEEALVINDRHCFELVVKVYRPSEKFASGGIMSQYLANISVGTNVQVRGPTGLFTYWGHGKWQKKAKAEPQTARHIGMIAGGSGITPMIQVLKQVLKDNKAATNPRDHVKVSLIYSNHTQRDILMKDFLDALVKEDRDDINIWFTVTREKPKKWAYSTTRVDRAMLEEHLPSPKSTENPVVLLCGPTPMVMDTCKPLLLDMGFAADNIIVM